MLALPTLLCSVITKTLKMVLSAALCDAPHIMVASDYAADLSVPILDRG